MRASRFIPLAIFIAVVAGLIAAAWIWGDERAWGPDQDHTHVVQVVDDQGQPVGDGTAVIIDRDRGPFFFPFGFLLVPLFIFLLFWTFAPFWRGRGPNGGPPAYPTDTPPAWFEHWYRQMQRRDAGSPPQPSQDG